MKKEKLPKIGTLIGLAAIILAIIELGLSLDIVWLQLTTAILSLITSIVWFSAGKKFLFSAIIFFLVALTWFVIAIL